VHLQPLGHLSISKIQLLARHALIPEPSMSPKCLPRAGSGVFADRFDNLPHENIGGKVETLITMQNLYESEMLKPFLEWPDCTPVRRSGDSAPDEIYFLGTAAK